MISIRIIEELRSSQTTKTLNFRRYQPLTRTDRMMYAKVSVVFYVQNFLYTGSSLQIPFRFVVSSLLRKEEFLGADFQVDGLHLYLLEVFGMLRAI